MKIKNIVFGHNTSYVSCKSVGYSVSTNVIGSQDLYQFITGINYLDGEIDSGFWAVSYLLSMYRKHSKDFILFRSPEVEINGNTMPLEELLPYSCYMDRHYPLYSTRKTIRQMVTRGIKKNHLDMSADDVRDLFQLDSQRFERPLQQVGNEKFRCMGAIGYVYGKQVYCFPWLSASRFEAYHGNMTWLLDTLKSLEMIAIVPRGKKD